MLKISWASDRAVGQSVALRQLAGFVKGGSGVRAAGVGFELRDTRFVCLDNRVNLLLLAFGRTEVTQFFDHRVDRFEKLPHNRFGVIGAGGFSARLEFLALRLPFPLGRDADDIRLLDELGLVQGLSLA